MCYVTSNKSSNYESGTEFEPKETKKSINKKTKSNNKGKTKNGIMDHISK